MHTKLIACLALGLAICAPLGSQAAGEDRYTSRDARMPIPITAKERNQVLYEMRTFLHGLVNLHAALAKEDYKAVATNAREMGPLFSRLPESMKERLPEEFSQLGIAMRESFEALAREAETTKNMGKVQYQLSETMTYCSGCHDTYRFDVQARLPAAKR